MKKLIKIIDRFRNIDSVINKTHKINTSPSIYQEDTKLLASEGTGTVFVRFDESKAFDLDLIAKNALLRLSVGHQKAKLYCIYKGRFVLLSEKHSNDVGLETDPTCVYWLSFDAITRMVQFGKNEAIHQNVRLSFTLPESNKAPDRFWMNKIAHYRVGVSA